VDGSRLDLRRRPLRGRTSTPRCRGDVDGRPADGGGTMSLSGFAHPWWLLWLIAVAAVAAGYLLIQLRRRRTAMRFASFELLDSVAPRKRRWYLHVPAVLLVLGLVGLTIATAGPTA